MDIDLKNTWKDTLDLIKISVSPAIYSTWFSQTHLSSIKEQEQRDFAEVGCNSAFVKSTIEGRYFGLIQDSLSKVLNKPCDLIFIVKDNPDKNKPIEESFSPLFQNQNPAQNTNFTDIQQRAKLRPYFTFENFAVSGSNQMAHAAALAVSESLGNAYNPLFLWGGVGVGKTHLMVSVGNTAIIKKPDLKVLFCTSETFTNDIVQGIRNKTTQEFRNKYRRLDLLMIDDIQFIAGKDSVQEEFFHTFNAVTSEGGQIILTSDRPPGEISKLEERLRSRFEAGLIVDISPPDFELRCAIIQIKSQQKDLNLDMESIQLIAGNIESARKIEGFLTQLITSVKFRGIPLTKEYIETQLGKKGQDTSSNLNKKSPEEVIDYVVKYYQVGKRQLLGSSRMRPLARPRQVLMYILRTHLNVGLEEVGRLVGRDHTTVMHAVEKITQLAVTDVQIREDISKIKLGI